MVRPDGLRSGGQPTSPVQEWQIEDPLIGTTKKGAGRTATSAVNKASEVFYKLHGVSTIDVHIVTCTKRKNVQTWKRLESALIDASCKRYFELPHYNRVRPKPTEGLLEANAPRKLLRDLSQGDFERYPHWLSPNLSFFCSTSIIRRCVCAGGPLASTATTRCGSLAAIAM